MSLIVEPDRGMAPIYALLAAPVHTLDMVMYELVDSTASSILAADAARGVMVRVVLDGRRERWANEAAFAYLRSHGVITHWAPTSYPATHEKSFVLDGASPTPTAVVMTLNFTSRYYPTTRDFAVVDHDRADAEAIESVFDLDFSSAPRGTASPAGEPPGDHLLWSPGALAGLRSVIASATTSLAVEAEEMSSATIDSALAAAAQAGVREQITMTANGRYDRALSALVGAGVAVHTDPDAAGALYIHAKAVVALGRTPLAFVGSENFSTVSLGRNRELGIVTADPAIVGPLEAVLAGDFARAPAFAG